MKYLLDTNIILWLMEGNARLPRKLVASIEAKPQDYAFSAASAWEVAIKQSLGKLKVTEDIFHRLEDAGMTSLAINLSDTEVLEKLGNHHKDPFDRMLIAQSIRADLTVTTADKQFVAYKQARIELI